MQLDEDKINVDFSKISKFNVNDRNQNKDNEKSSNNIKDVIETSKIGLNTNSNKNINKLESDRINTNIKNINTLKSNFIYAKLQKDSQEVVINKDDILKILDEKIKKTIENYKSSYKCDIIVDEDNSLFSIFKYLPPFSWIFYKDENIKLNQIQEYYISNVSIENTINIQRKLDLIEKMCCLENEEIIRLLNRRVN